MIFLLLFLSIFLSFISNYFFNFVEYRVNNVAFKRNISIKVFIIVSILYYLVLLIFSNLIGTSIRFWTFTVLFLIFVISSWEDYKYQMVEDEVSVFTIIAGVLFVIINRSDIFDLISGFLAGGGILYLIAVLTKGGMGGADIKLMAAYGIFLGYKLTFLALLVGFCLGALISLILILLKIKKRNEAIPFSPFLSLGTIIAFLYGNSIIDMYIDYLLG